MQRYLIIILSIGLISYSCEKGDKDVSIDLSANEWLIVKSKVVGAKKYDKADNEYVVEFTDDSLFVLSLDVNNCAGYFTILDEGKIIINSPGCTEACCDAKFGEELIQLFPLMTDYYWNGKELIFEGSGTIVCEKR